MAVTWNSTTWLESNCLQSNGLPAFYIEGKYLLDQKNIAEQDFKSSVEQMSGKSYTDDNINKWTKNVVDSDYLCLRTTETENYWKNLLFRTNVVNELLNAEKDRFIVSGPSDYQTPMTTKNKRTTQEVENIVTISKINIEETDGIILDGLNISVMSFIKTKAINEVHNYNNCSS
ncbi:hypothetical protein EDC94DRAFT_30193 [Helicostylum pulchrum]|nr:hypothetical protein EDC94DRAFT_30193 [Helicostylum pulchrum]